MPERKRNYILSVRLSEEERKLLDELIEMVGCSSSELIRILILAFHVIVFSGAYEILRPLPELALLAIRKKSSAVSRELPSKEPD